MPRPCLVCHHPDLVAIDEALVGGASFRSVAGRWSVSRDSVRRHSYGHLPIDLAAIRAAEKLDEDVATWRRVEGLYARADRILAQAEADGKATLGLAALRELRATCELLAKLKGELDTRPTTTINITASKEWHEIRTVVLGILEPDQRIALADQLERLQLGSGS